MAKDFSQDGALGAEGGASTPPGVLPSSAGTGSNGNPGSTTNGIGIGDSSQATNTAPSPMAAAAAAASQPNLTAGALEAAPNSAGTTDQGPLYSGPIPENPMSGVLYGNNGNYAFDQGGAVPDDEDSDSSDQQPQSAPAGNSDDLVAQALAAVKDTLQFTRQQYGLGGDQQQAANMPAVPGSQSESGIPPLQPAPGALPPTSNPFGKRTTPPRPGQMASNMPAIPGTQSDSGVAPIQPAPGPLPPTSNPFGRRTTPPRAGAQMGAIPDDDEEAA